MTTSGTISETVFRTNRVIDRAFGRCKIPQQKITAELIQTAKDNLYLMLSNLSMKGVQLWCIEKLIIGTYENKAMLTLPDGTYDLIGEPNYRTTSRLEGTNTSSAGGTVANAFDDDFDTACTQTSTNGNISTEFDEDTLVTTVGILPNTSATWSLVFERSDDGVTWTTAYTVGAQAYVNSEWSWFDIDGNLEATYFRVRETAGGTLNVREIYWGNTPQEIEMGRLNKDSYTTLPNKTFSGKPVQFWFDQQRDNPVLHMWPVTALTNRYDQIIVWRQRYIQDVGTLTETLDVPQKWFEPIIAGLAARIAAESAEVPDQREAMLKMEAASALAEVQGAERDNSPFTITPMIGGYTR